MSSGWRWSLDRSFSTKQRQQQISWEWRSTSNHERKFSLFGSRDGSFALGDLLIFCEVRFLQITKDHLSHLPVKGQPSSEAWLFIFNPRGTWDIVHPLKILSRWSKPSNVDMAKWWPQRKHAHDWSPETEGTFHHKLCFLMFFQKKNQWKGLNCRKVEITRWINSSDKLRIWWEISTWMLCPHPLW